MASFALYLDFLFNWDVSHAGFCFHTWSSAFHGHRLFLFLFKKKNVELNLQSIAIDHSLSWVSLRYHILCNAAPNLGWYQDVELSRVLDNCHLQKKRPQSPYEVSRTILVDQVYVSLCVCVSLSKMCLFRIHIVITLDVCACVCSVCVYACVCKKTTRQ